MRRGTLVAMRPALALLPATVLLLAGCASGPTDSAPDGTTGLTGTVAASTMTPALTTTPSETTAPIPSSTGAAMALPTVFTDVNQSISDPELGQSIAVRRIARQLPWPAGYNASAQAYELVAVEMTWTPSKTYTIPVSKQDFTVNTGTALANTPDNLVDGALTAGGWTLLPDSVSTGDAVTGWMVFKVDPRAAPKLVLDYKRPASTVSGGSQTFTDRAFSVSLVG